MSLNAYDYQEELGYISMGNKSYNVTISNDNKIISIDEDGALMAAIALEFVDNTLYLKGKDDNLLAEIELPNYILSIDELAYNDEEKRIDFIASHVNGDKVNLSVGVQDLVDLYTAGDGISIEDNKISVKIAEDSYEYLSTSEEGISIDLKEITKGIDGNISEIDSIKEDIELMKGDIESIESDINGINDSLVEIVLQHDTDIDDLKSIVGEQGEDAGALTNRVAELEQIIGKQGEDSGVLTERVAELENTVGEQGENAGALTNRVASLEELIGDVQGSMSEGDDSILDRIDSLEETVGERIEGVESSLIEMVNANTNAIDALKTSTEEKFESVESEISDLSDKHDSEVSVINDKVSANTESIANNASDIESLDVDIKGLKTALNNALTIEYPTIRVNDGIYGATTSSEIDNSTIGGNLESVINKVYAEMQKTADSHTEDINKFINESFVPLKSVVDKLDGNDNVEGSVKNLVTKEVAKIVDEAPEAFDTLKEIAKYIESDMEGAAALANSIADNASEIANVSASIDEETSNRESEISRVESLVTAHKVECQTEFDSLNAKDDDLDSKIDDFISESNGKFALISVVEARDNDIFRLARSNEIDIANARLDINQNKADIDEVKSSVIENKRISDEAIDSLNAQISDEKTARETSVESALNEAKSYSDANKIALETSLETSVSEINASIASVSTVADRAKEMSDHLSNTIEHVYFNGLSDEDSSNISLIRTLISRIDTLEQELAHLKGTKTEVGSMAYYIDQSLVMAKAYTDEKSSESVSESKAYTDSSIETSENSVYSQIEASVTSAKTEVKAYTDTAKDAAISASNAYTDVAKLNAVAESKTYTDSSKTEAIESSKAYTDEKVSDINTSISNLRDYTDNKFVNYSTSLEMTNAINTAVNEHISSVDTKFVDFSTVVDGKISNAIDTEIIRADGKYETKGTCVKMSDVTALNYISADALAARNYQNADQVDAKVAVVNSKIDTNYYTKETVDSMHNTLNNAVISNKALADVTYASKTELNEHIAQALTLYVETSDANATYATIANLGITNGNVNANTTKINAMKSDIEAMDRDIDIIKMQLNPLG